MKAPATGATPPSPGHWTIPYSRNPFFTARETLLSTLEYALHSESTAALTQTQAISGLGGIGKTQIAVEYAYRFRDRYSAILWAQGPSREELLASYGRLAKALKLGNTSSDVLAIHEVRSYLEGHQNWLLVIDNADDLKVVEEFIPLHHRGHILLTTREQSTGHVATSIPVESLSDEDGALLLLRRGKLVSADADVSNLVQKDRRAAESLSAELGGLPLALDQAGAFIEEVPSTIEEYHALYLTEGEKLRAARGQRDFGHPSVSVTFSLAFGQIKEHRYAESILSLCAFCAPHDIPEVVFHTHFAKSVSAPFTAFDYLQAIRAAARYSLITRNTSDNSVNIHRLVQQVIRDETNPDTEEHLIRQLAGAIEQSYPRDEFLDWTLCRKLDPQARSCLAHLDRLSLNISDAALLLKHLAVVLLERLRGRESEEYARRAVRVAEAAVAPAIVLADCLHTLGRAELNLGRTSDARATHERAAKLNEEHLPEGHRNIAVSLNNLGMVCKVERRFAKGLELYGESVRVLRRCGHSERHLLGEH